MMNASSHLHRLRSTQPSSSLIPKPFFISHSRSSSPASLLPTRRRSSTLEFHGKQKCLSIRASATDRVKGVETSKDNASSVKAVIRATAPGLLSDLLITKPLDVFQDLIGKTLLLELVSAEIDSGKVHPNIITIVIIYKIFIHNTMFMVDYSVSNFFIISKDLITYPFDMEGGLMPISNSFSPSYSNRTQFSNSVFINEDFHSRNHLQSYFIFIFKFGNVNRKY